MISGPAAASAPADAGAESGRAVRLPRRERREQLLAAAREVFVAHGYHAAAMDDIAVRAGVSKPVLYQHFPSKLDLYLALLDAGADALVAAVRDALGSTQDNKLRVQATVLAYYAFVDDPAGAYRLVFESDLTNDPAVRGRLEILDRQCADLVSAVIAADTGLSAAQARLLASGLLGMAQVSARRWLRDRDTVPLEDAAALVDLLAWRGIGGFPLSHPSG
ncbi:MAG: TetR/AcrR family transcriptional regulator [Actinomycetota bacterium]|nr:MAG: TetR/AcrR family transcriptional regulator [Actinomycetota bacterium]